MAKKAATNHNSTTHVVEYKYDGDGKHVHKMRATVEEVPVGSNMVYVRKSVVKDPPTKVTATFVVE